MSDSPPAITLDAGGVLLLPDPAAMCEALAAFDAEPDEATYWRVHYEVMGLVDGTDEPDYAALSRVMAAALGVPPERCEAAGPVVSETFLSSRWVPAPGAGEALRRLESAGHPLIVISNSGHGQVEDLLSEAALCGTSGSGARVVAVLDSGVLGIEKPDPRIFDLALARLGTTADRCIHVGDSIRMDVDPARRAGMTAVHIDPLASCPGADHDHAPSLAGFVDRLLG